MLATGLTLWLTRSPGYSGEKNMASLWLKKPALFYEKDPCRLLYKLILLKFVKKKKSFEGEALYGLNAPQVQESGV